MAKKADSNIEEMIENYEMRRNKNFQKSLKKAQKQYKKGEYKTLDEMKKYYTDLSSDEATLLNFVEDHE